MFKMTNILRVPGPSPIPPSVQLAMSQPMISHRTPESKKLINEIRRKIKPVFGTKQDVIILTSSGTSALEAAVTNTVTSGDEVLVLVTGEFGDHFAQICKKNQLIVHRLDVTWGEAVEPDQVKKILLNHPKIKVVFATYSETSTGVLNPIKEISTVVHEHSDALVVADGVSCIGGVDARMDEWGIDLLITGSQKAMMLPPGLAFIAVSERAWRVIEGNKHPRYYLDLQLYRNFLEADSTPHTPAVSLLFGLDEALNLMEEEGLEEVFKRHNTMMKMTRESFKALDIPLLALDKDASPTVTAIKPKDFDAEQLRNQLKLEFGLDLAGGLQHLAGKIIRIGHMGYCHPADILQMISLIEIGLQRMGKQVQLGQGVKVAQEIYIRNYESTIKNPIKIS